MTCATITTGTQFLASMLDHVDCQAQSIGTFGYSALADSGSPAAELLLALLTLFIAVFGLRLMFGHEARADDVVGSVIKIGIVLTLATSWPAWRTLGYDLVMSAPSQLASAIGGASGLPTTRAELNQRLQGVDDGIVSLTASGTGRLTGAIAGPVEAARGIALADQSGFAWGRIAFLTGTLGPLGLIRMGSGILLALAPLMAGLLLFAGTRDLFVGWLRALLACAFAGLCLSLCYAVELVILEGWLHDALLQRNANLLTPATPTELLAITLAFALISWSLLALVGRMTFHSGLSLDAMSWMQKSGDVSDYRWRPSVALPINAPNMRSNELVPRAQLISGSIAQTLRMETLGNLATEGSQNRSLRHSIEGVRSQFVPSPLGSSFKRTTRRHSVAASQRDSRP